MRRLLPLLLLPACAGAEPAGTATKGTSELDYPTDEIASATSAPPATSEGVPGVPACAAGVVLLDWSFCLDSTAVVPAPGDGYEPIVAAGTVIEVGARTPGPDAEGVFPHYGCRDVASVTDTVRMVDDAGATWTVGWSVAAGGPHAADLFAPGDRIDLENAVNGTADYVGGWRIFLRESGTLRLAISNRGYPEPDEIEGLTVTIGDSCTAPDPALGEFWHHELVFGDVGLWSGQAGTTATDAGPLQVVVPYAGKPVDCSDGCEGDVWLGWR